MSDIDAIVLLKRLIACRSVTPAQAGALDIAGDILAAAGFAVRRLPKGEVDNLWAVKGGAARLLFAGHVDVVPPGDVSAWRSDPFAPAEEGGYIYGRGAADMKSGVAAMVAAAANAAADGVGVFLTSDEEGASVDGARYFCDWFLREGGGAIDYGVIGEPTCGEVFGDAIKTGRRGSLTARVRISGTQTHAAYAYRGDNPAHRLAAVLTRLAAAWRDNIPAQAAGETVTTFQATDIQSGVGADNVTPPYADAVFNFRYTAADGADVLRERVTAILNEEAENRWQCEWQAGAEPYEMPAGELVAALREVVAEVTGVTPALTAGGGTSDGRYLRRICRQMAEFGVRGETMHEVNERVCVADARRLAQVYARLIRRLL